MCTSDCGLFSLAFATYCLKWFHKDCVKAPKAAGIEGVVFGNVCHVHLN